MELAVFNLQAVIRYDKSILRKCFLNALNDVYQLELKKKDVLWEGNSAEVLLSVTLNQFNRQPTDKEITAVGDALNQYVKIEFIQDDDLLEVRPGVQSVFRQIEKRDNWKYAIVSEYWGAVTHFMLQSCGVFSKDKYTLTADDAKGSKEQLKTLLDKSKKFDAKTEILFINGKKKRENFLGKHIHMGKSKNKENYFTYPKFSDLLKKLKNA